MTQILITCREAFAAAIALIPIYWLMNRYLIHDTKKSMLYLIFSIYLSAMYAAVGLPDVTYWRFHINVNFRPFLYMFSAWETTLLNVLLFLPLGFFMPMLWKQYHSPVKTITLGFGISAAVELLQIFTYRASDINDLMTNTFGTLVGYLAAMGMKKWAPVFPSSEKNDDIALIFGTVFGTMFFIYPFLIKLI